MENEKKFKKIREIAVEASENGIKIKRADLATLLMKDIKSITEDSYAINELISQVYSKSDSSTKKAISRTFVSNDLVQFLIRPGRIKMLKLDFEKSNELDIFSFEQEQISNLLKMSFEIVTEYEEEISILVANVKNYVKKSGGLGGIFKAITGTAKIEKVQTEGQHVYEQYIGLINFYEEAKQILINYIEDYETIRGNLNAVYLSHVNNLKDFFGDQIIAVDPDMFDYGTITWLDSTSMLDGIKTSYDDLNKKCGTLIGNINSKLITEGLDTLSSGFDNIMNIDFSDKKKAKKQAAVAGGLAVANMGFALVEAHMEAAEKATALGEELEEMKNLFNIDIANIQKEGFRFNKILKIVKDFYLPVTEMVYQNLNEVIDPNLSDLLYNAYSVEGVKDLKNERNTVLSEHRNITLEISDIGRSLNAYINKVEQTHVSIIGINAIEKFIKKMKPKKWSVPLTIFLILSVLSVFVSEENGLFYAIPFIIGGGVFFILRKKKKKRWFDLYAETENDLARIHSYEKQMSAAKLKEVDLKIKAQQLSVELQQKLIKNQDVRNKLSENLLNIFKVLKSVKRVLSAGLDVSDIEPKEIKKQEIGKIITLSPETEQQLLNICSEKSGVIYNKYVGSSHKEDDSLTIGVANGGSEIAAHESSITEFESSVKSQLRKKLTEDKLKEMAEKGAKIIIAQMDLKAKKERNLQKKEEYISQIAEDEKLFKAQMLKIENSVELVSIIRKDLENNPNVNKMDALMALSELIPTNDSSLVSIQREINNFLNGREETLEL